MSQELQDLAISKFLEFYSGDLVSESVDENNVVISFPIHFSGFHRVEVTVSRVNPNLFIISDGARTIEELKSSGYPINSRLKKRLETISRLARIRVVNNHLIAEADADSLGSSIQRFIEAAKTIGDAYLVQRAYPPRDTNLVDQVSEFLASRQVPYQRKHTLRGKIEDHTVDFYFPPNGVPGLALSVMSNPTHIAAQAWAFKSGDIKLENARTKTGIVYESDGALGKSTTAILQHSADMAVPSSEMQVLQSGLREIGILKNG
jgi:hypothetical protein